MKKSYKIISILLMGSVLLSDCTTLSLAKSKSRFLKEKDYPFCCKVTTNEYFEYDDPLAEDAPQWSIYRTDFGLVAKNVKKVWASANADRVFVSTKKNEIREIDFSHRKKRGEILYKTSLVSKTGENMCSNPSDVCCYFKNKAGDVFYSGYSKCYSVWKHRSEAECRKTYGTVVKHQKILSNVKKCWSGAGMFAYVQDNSLKIIWSWRVTEHHVDCYERKQTADTYFKGQGDNIREVVCTGVDSKLWCIFVLMNDGSVWGKGNNRKMLNSESQDFSEEFVKIIPGGVKKIRACEDRVAVIKDDKTLWMWGKGMKTENEPYLLKPVKVADGVKDISIGREGEYMYMLVLKTNHAAYGMGRGDCDNVFTKNHTKKWYAKPVKLMENVKKVYTFGADGGASLILTRNNELYWMGETSFNWLWYQWMDGEKWRLPKLERKNLVEDKKTLKMLGVW